MSARARLTLSYLGFLGLAAALLAVVLWYLLRFVPTDANDSGTYFPTRSEFLEAVLPRAAQGLAVLAVFALVGGWLLAGRMLAPLSALDAAAREVAAGSFDHRANPAGPHDEFYRLGVTFDSMLDRVQALVAEQERFAANASHELRTPAAAARAVIEVALNSPDAVLPLHVLRQLDELNRRTIEIIDALLALSILDHTDALAVTPIDVAELLQFVLTDVTAAAEAAHVRITADVHEGDFDGDPVLVRQLMTNLLLNAIRHNLPADGWLHLSSRTADDGTVSVRVANTGPAVSPELLATMTEPFVRGQGRTTQHGDAQRGAGLGLALVARIALAHDARLQLESRDAGGLDAEVRFPPPGAPDRAD